MLLLPPTSGAADRLLTAQKLEERFAKIVRQERVQERI